MIVLDDVDFSAASMLAAFTNTTHAGQGCALTFRLRVPREHHDAGPQRQSVRGGMPR
jgi:acyl-CoA reductase-like NAD-dependent aldehyde dehydrogenase